VLKKANILTFKTLGVFLTKQTNSRVRVMNCEHFCHHFSIKKPHLYFQFEAEYETAEISNHL